MKTLQLKQFAKFFIVSFLAVCMTLTSCSKTEEAPPEQFVGAWYSVDSVELSIGFRKYKEVLLIKDNTFTSKFLNYSFKDKSYKDSLSFQGVVDRIGADLQLTKNEAWDYYKKIGYSDTTALTLNEYLYSTVKMPRVKSASYLVGGRQKQVYDEKFNLDLTLPVAGRQMQVIYKEYELDGITYPADTVMYINYRL